MGFNDLITSTRIDLLAAVLLLLVALIAQTYRRRWKGIPPGPTGLPIVGYIPFLTRKPHLKLMELGKKYGDVISVKFGSRNVVVLNSGAAIREAFSKPELLGRPDQKLFFIVDIKSPFFDNGKVWQEHRRFAYRVFRELADGRAMEKHMKEEIENFIGMLNKQRSKPTDVTYYLTSSIANFITALIFGKRYEFRDPERKILDNFLNEASKSVGASVAVVFFPWIKRIALLRKLCGIDRFVRLYTEFAEFTKKLLVEHKENSSDENRREDFIDFYLSELSSKPQKDMETTLSENLIPDSVQILYGAGSETVRTTLSWCFYTMAAYQKVQERVQAEIDEVVGRERTPSMSDHKSMPYTQSVLMEVQRWQTVLPLSVMRMALADTYMDGHRIPKGTFVIPNLWAAHHDPRCWNNPDDFQPERFLSPDGGSIIKDINYMPFSFGKRNCVGERIAVVEVFLYFTCILQKFKLQLPEDCEPNFDAISTITYQLKPRELCFLPRE